MNTLFDMNIEQKLLQDRICDPETGEINEEVAAQLDALDIDIADKRDGWCYWLKQDDAEIEAMEKVVKHAQEQLAIRKKAHQNARKHFEELMHGEKHKSAFNSVYYTRNQSVALDEGKTVLDVDDDYLTYSEPTLNKAKIKAALKLGKEIPGVHLEESTSMVIK